MKPGQYMKVNEGQFEMKGGVRDTLFGLIGNTKGNQDTRTLGGLVGEKPHGKVPSDLKKGKVADATEKHIGGKNATFIPGQHSGQVPFAGKFYKKVGPKL